MLAWYMDRHTDIGEPHRIQSEKITKLRFKSGSAVCVALCLTVHGCDHKVVNRHRPIARQRRILDHHALQSKRTADNVVKVDISQLVRIAEDNCLEQLVANAQTNAF